MPTQVRAADPLSWTSARAIGQDSLAMRAWKKLKSDELIIPQMGAIILRKHLDDVPLWRGDHVAIRQLGEDFARYLYLPRLRNTGVLIDAIRDGLASTSWDRETFAYAESYDEGAKRFAGLRTGQHVNVSDDGMLGILVKPEVAQAQIAAETKPAAASGGAAPASAGSTPTTAGAGGGAPKAGTTMNGPAKPAAPKRFYGTVKIDAARMNRDAGQISQEVVQHLVAILMADVEVTLEIQVTAPDGFPQTVVRTVGENCRTLKFTQQEFTGD